MNHRRRHWLGLAALLAALPLSGAECVEGLSADEERADCEAVCAAEAQCDLGRDELTCRAALCADDGFQVIADDSPVDLQTLAANECMKAATDCAALALCSCADSCARVAECTGSAEPACLDNCEILLEQDTSLYLENRCKMESACADLAVCGQVG